MKVSSAVITAWVGRGMAGSVGFRGSDFGFVRSGFEFRISGFGFRVLGFGFRVSGCGLRVSGFEFRVSGLGQGEESETSRHRRAPRAPSCASASAAPVKQLVCVSSHGNLSQNDRHPTQYRSRLARARGGKVWARISDMMTFPFHASAETIVFPAHYLDPDTADLGTNDGWRIA